MDHTNVSAVPQLDDKLFQQLLDYATADVAIDREPGFILSASFEHASDCGKDRLPSPWILFLPDRKNVRAVMESLGEYFKRPDLVLRILDEETQTERQQIAIRCQLKDGLKDACPCLRRIAVQAFEFAKIMGVIVPADDPTMRVRAYLESKTGQNGKLGMPVQSMLAAVDATPNAAKIIGDESGIRRAWTELNEIVPGSRHWWILQDRTLTFIPGRKAAENLSVNPANRA